MGRIASKKVLFCFKLLEFEGGIIKGMKRFFGSKQAYNRNQIAEILNGRYRGCWKELIDELIEFGGLELFEEGFYFMNLKLIKEYLFNSEFCEGITWGDAFYKGSKLNGYDLIEIK